MFFWLINTQRDWKYEPLIQKCADHHLNRWYTLIQWSDLTLLCLFSCPSLSSVVTFSPLSPSFFLFFLCQPLPPIFLISSIFILLSHWFLFSISLPCRTHEFCGFCLGVSLSLTKQTLLSWGKRSVLLLRPSSPTPSFSLPRLHVSPSPYWLCQW